MPSPTHLPLEGPPDLLEACLKRTGLASLALVVLKLVLK